MTLSEIIERVEAATGPDRELDAHVLAALVGGTVQRSPLNGEWCVYSGTDRMGRPRLWQPSASQKQWWDQKFTASLDAALTLMPVGWMVSQMGEWDHHLLRESGPCMCIVMRREDRGPLNPCWDTRCDHAATLPLAVTAASLRARLASEQSA